MKLRRYDLLCEICNRMFKNKNLLVKHINRHVHPLVFSCSECSKTFPTKTRLRIHNLVHSGERPFRCPYCEIYFASRFQLKLHSRRHTGEKPYSCTSCKKEFSSSSGLRQHVKTHTKESPFICNRCGRGFKQKEKLKQHERVHTGAKPFMCDQCPKTFRVKNTLNRHLRIHSGNMYKCPLCPKEFGELYSLKKHHRNKHDSCPFFGPSKQPSSKEQDSSSQIDTTPTVSNAFTFKQEKYKNKTNKRERKQKLKGQTLSVRHRVKEQTSDSDLGEDVINKLHLAIGQRDSMALVDENGWHRIPLPVATDLLSRNTDTIENWSSQDSNPANQNNAKQGDMFFTHKDSLVNPSPRRGRNTHKGQICEQDLKSVELCDIKSRTPHTMIPNEISTSITESCSSLHLSNIHQEIEWLSHGGKERWELTCVHPSTIEYFPAADEVPRVSHMQEGESQCPLKIHTQDMESAPHCDKSSCISHHSGQEDPNFMKSETCSKKYCIKCHTQSLDCQLPHERPYHTRGQMQESSFVTCNIPCLSQMGGKGLNIEKTCHKATLHHCPELYNHGCSSHQPSYLHGSHQSHHCDKVSGQAEDHHINQDRSWHQNHFDEQAAARFKGRQSLGEHLHQTKTSELTALHPLSTSFHQPSTSSSEHVENPSGLPHKYSSSQWCNLSQSIKSNQTLINQFETLKSDQILHHQLKGNSNRQQESLKPNQLVEDHCEFYKLVPTINPASALNTTHLKPNVNSTGVEPIMNTTHLELTVNITNESSTLKSPKQLHHKSIQTETVIKSSASGDLYTPQDLGQSFVYGGKPTLKFNNETDCANCIMTDSKRLMLDEEIISDGSNLDIINNNTYNVACKLNREKSLVVKGNYHSLKVINENGSNRNVMKESSELKNGPWHIDFTGADNCEENITITTESGDEFNEDCPHQSVLKKSGIVIKKAGITEAVETDHNADQNLKSIEGPQSCEPEITKRPLRTNCFSKYNTSYSANDKTYSKEVNPNHKLRSISSIGIGENHHLKNLTSDAPKQQAFITLTSKLKITRTKRISKKKVSSISVSLNGISPYCRSHEVTSITVPNTKSKGKNEQHKIKYVTPIKGKVEDVYKSDHHIVNSNENKIYYHKRIESVSHIIPAVLKKEEFKRSTILNKETGIINCMLCGKEYKQVHHLTNHIFTRHKQIHECPNCGKNFSHKARLERHIKTHISKNSFPCGKCNQAFTTRRYLDNHLKRHDKQPPIFKCEECEKIFFRRYQLKIHLRTHSGEKPYSCQHCSSTFATSFQVRLHERVHSDVRLFQCRFCAKFFRSNNNLSLHIKRHINDRPYLCATCGLAFHEASKLTAHTRLHTGIHPFMCDQCPKTFKVKHLLVRHMRRHNNDLFQCEHCNKSFDERWILRSHTLKHHPQITHSGKS